ncbi:hypothetical protein U0X36_26055 [Bacillus thuringiensis]|uniref:Uncharacterized protein n=1 Tax=Bacillus cereus (strain VD146) TaxID=1053236 RepID=R8ME37_BACCX|nr:MULTISPECIES: hypothetical protein [Bacillus cereus group]EOP32314.1 hypothetical protein IK1_05850 [Bacillus cereus VD146]MDZ3956279.1 hypothetical protein [Bacillus thuringiensis]RGP42644.1 hypothetical protein BTW32_30825 [Bacillus thuringiensis]
MITLKEMEGKVKESMFHFIANVSSWIEGSRLDKIEFRRYKDGNFIFRAYDLDAEEYVVFHVCAYDWSITVHFKEDKYTGFDLGKLTFI